MTTFQPDFTALNAAAQAQIDAAVAAAVAAVPAPAPVSGVSADQEAADIAAAVQPFKDQISALQIDDQQKTDLVANLQGTVDKIKALLA